MHCTVPNTPDLPKKVIDPFIPAAEHYRGVLQCTYCHTWLALRKMYALRTLRSLVWYVLALPAKPLRNGASARQALRTRSGCMYVRARVRTCACIYLFFSIPFMFAACVALERAVRCYSNAGFLGAVAYM